MLEPTVILQRFGDEEFLRELWVRTRGLIPSELEAIASLPRNDSDQLAPRLHKLRGLIANFLEGGEAIAALRECETSYATQAELSEEHWERFLEGYHQESQLLESWLAARGYPCS